MVVVKEVKEVVVEEDQSFFHSFFYPAATNYTNSFIEISISLLRLPSTIFNPLPIHFQSAL